MLLLRGPVAQKKGLAVVFEVGNWRIECVLVGAAGGVIVVDLFGLAEVDLLIARDAGLFAAHQDENQQQPGADVEYSPGNFVLALLGSVNN